MEYSYCFCFYFETATGKEILLNIPTNNSDLEEGLVKGLEDLKCNFGEDFPVRVEQKVFKIKDLGFPSEDSFFVLIFKGPYAGVIGCFDGVGATGVSVLDYEVGTTYMVPKQHAVEIPTWDPEVEEWVSSSQ